MIRGGLDFDTPTVTVTGTGTIYMTKVSRTKDLDLVTETNAQEAPAPFGEGAGDPCVRAATFCRPATDERLASHYIYHYLPVPVPDRYANV